MDTNIYIQWNMPVAEDRTVTRYETQIDGSGWTNTGKSAMSSDGIVNEYQYPIAVKGIIAWGPHTAAVRACNLIGCTLPTPVAFSVADPNAPPAPPTTPPPLAPQNVRIVGN